MSEQSPPVMSNDEFAEAMRPMGTALSEWASVWSRQPAAFGYIPTADSRAMEELAAEHRWATPAWLEPARNAHSFGHMLSYALAEHLAAMATVIVHSPVGPAFAHVPSMRAIFDAVPVAHWLLDPRIDVERRIKRSLTFRLKSANEEGRMSHIPAAVAESARIRDACTRFAERHHWSTANNAIGGEQLPVAKHSYTAVALGKADKKLDATTWSVVSAAHHSTWYMLAASFSHGITMTTPLDRLGGMAPIVVDGDHLATFARMAWQGCAAVAQARDALMGWQPLPDMAAAAEEFRARSSKLMGTGR
jgi:hypothetical protein